MFRLPARRYGDEVRRAHGVTLEARVGLNSGDVMVRAIGSDLRNLKTAKALGPHHPAVGVGAGR